MPRARRFFLESKPFKEGLLLFLLIIVPFFPYLATVGKLSYIAFNNSSDALFYLDIANNIASGRGLVTSFNIYRYWPGMFYPAFAYVHVGLPIALSVLYFITGSIKSLFFFNLFLGLLNCFLIFTIVKKLYQDKTVAYWTTLLVASTVSMANTVLRPLTEQMSLTITLFAVLLFFSNQLISKRRILYIAYLLAIGVFVRSSTIFYPLAFSLAALFRRGDIKERTKEAVLLLLLPLVIVGVYELAIYLKFKVFFPVYPSAFKNYYLATFLTGGRFSPYIPVTRPFAEVFAIPNYFSVNLSKMSFVVFAMLRVLVVFVFVRLLKILKTRNKTELLFVWFVFLQVAATLFFFSYMRLSEFHLVRFLLLPIVCLAALSIIELKEFCRRLLPRTKVFFFHAVLLIVFLSNFYQSSKTLEAYWDVAARGYKVKALTAAAGWVKDNTADTDLIAASEYVLGGVFFDRPIVNLPAYNLLKDGNLEDFFSIYAPKAVIFEQTLPISNQLRRLGYKEANGWPSDCLFLIFQR